MAGKPPTPQAISVLLRKAGFARATAIPGRVGWDGTVLRSNRKTAGYQVKGDGDRVSVTCLTAEVTSPDRTYEQRLDTLRSYAAAITAAGFSARLLTENGRLHLIVSGCPEPEPEENSR
jgi:hypothetical protein